jgi:hypothetical protein
MTCLGLGNKAGRMNVLYMTSWYLTTLLTYGMRPSRCHASYCAVCIVSGFTSK